MHYSDINLFVEAFVAQTKLIILFSILSEFNDRFDPARLLSLDIPSFSNETSEIFNSTSKEASVDVSIMPDTVVIDGIDVPMNELI